MKLILSENQYKILENILSEVSKPMSTKIEKGGYIQVVYVVSDVEKSQTLEITDVYGTGQYVRGVGGDGDYIINVGSSLDDGANTFTVLKGGEYKEGSVGKNGKVLPGEVVGGSKMVVKNVTQVNISDSGKNVVDKLYTDLGDKKKIDNSTNDEEKANNLKSSQERQEEKKMREKRVYDMIINNPQLKKAFYHQPKLFGGLLNYGKAKGIGPAKKLLSKYLSGYDLGDDKEDDKTKGDKVFSDFKVNKSVIYQVGGKPVRISYGSEDFILDVGRNYPSRYVGKQYLKGKVSGITYKIYMKEKVGSDTYKGTIKAFFKENDDSVVDRMEDITITVKDYNY